MKLPLQPLTVLATFAALLFPLTVNAQFTFASDNAGNYGGVGEPTFGTGGNGGMGFAAWSFTTGGNAGGFIGNPADGGISGMSSESFGLFANPTNSGNFIDANRNLSTAMQVGDTFSFDWGVNFDADGPGNKGFNLYVGGVQLINVNMGGNEAITINGANSGFTYGANVMTWRFHYSDPTTLVITANDRDGSGSYSNNFTVSGGIDAFRWYAAQLNNSSFADQRQPYYNNLLITNSGLYNVAATQTEARFLTGSGNLAKTGNGTLTISGTTNNFTGTVGITNGAIRATANSALGSASSVTVQSGAALEYSGGITVARNLTLNGTGISTGGALRNTSGDNTHSGGITLGSASRIASDAGTLTVSGNISGSGLGLTVGGAGNVAIQTAIGIGTGRLTKEDAGTLTLSGANAYSGGTLVAGGTLIGDTRSLQGAITNTASVAFNQTTNGSYTGLMSGAGGTLAKSGNGTVTLTANNSYTGATTIGGGRLVVNGAQSSSAVTISNGASLGGSGTVGALTVSGLLAPGNSIGTLSAGNTTFNGGGSFELEVFDWVNTAGTGWDLLAVTGNLTLNNTSGNTFAINLVSLANSTTPGLSTDWNQNANFTNTFITYSGSLLGTSFASNLFTVNTNGFQNAINGTFSITNVTGGLALLYTTSFAPSSTYTWNVGSGLWGTAGNWTNGTAPTNGASIIFSGAGGASTNSSTVSSVQGLVFSNTAGAYTISGSALAVGAGGISNASTAAQTISNNLSLSTPASITASGGNVTLAGNLTNGGNAVTVGGAANTIMSGTVSGSGALSKLGSGTLLLGGANSYTGTTTISGGTVVANNTSSLGATNGGTTVADGASLHLSSGVASAENITITGSGVGGGGAIRSLGDGENTLTGTITLGGNARINADSPIGSAIPLVSLGSSGFAVDTESGFTTAAFSQGVSSLSLTNATAGQTLFGSLVSVADWVAYQYFGFDMAVTGTNPNIGFAIEFMDGDFNTLATYSGTTAGITSSGGVSLLDLVSGGEDLSAVGALYFTWAGSETNFVATISNIVSVPVSNFEITGPIQGGNNVLTFGAGGPTAQGVGGNLAVSGIISGAGNTATNAATTTSLIKDGAGILTLSGANTYTGDTRIEAGTVTVASGGSLGSGSDVFLSGTSVLRLLNNVTVGSFQGTTNTTVFINAGQRLTMNGANKGTVVQAGRITGDGGLTLAGSGNTLLQLTGDNDFRGTTVVSGGVLELAATGAGAGALRISTGVTVGSGAILLISDSDQILDTASISLSGGTIRRGPGVNETMGGLTLTAPSTLDFGAGSGQGTMAFAGSYLGNGHKLTISNFDFGSTLSFRSNLTSSIGNTALFEFVNGGFSSTSWNGTTFTITAIPEPSTYVVALGLLGLMLWSQRRSLRRWIR